MYRVLAEAHEVRERRDQLRHPPYAKPELLATQPNQVWSWDITKLKGPVKWTLLLPVRHPRHLQPLRGRLDGRPRRGRPPGRTADRGDLHQAEHRAGPAHHPRRPRTGHDQQDRRAALLGPRHPAQPLAALRLRRQPLLGVPLQDPQVPARLPRPLRLARARASGLPPAVRLVQHRAPPQRLWPSSRRPPCTTAAPTRSSMRVTASASPPTPRTPSASSTGRRGAQSLPNAVWINPPEKTTHQDAPGSTQTRSGRP